MGYLGSRKVNPLTDISLSFEPNPVTGDLTVLTNERAINNAIKNIIMTVPIEVPFDRDMGSKVADYLFEFVDPGTAGMLHLEIQRAIKYNEPRVEDVKVSVDIRNDQNAFECRVEYKIVGYDQVYKFEHLLKPTR